MNMSITINNDINNGRNIKTDNCGRIYTAVHDVPVLHVLTAALQILGY